jgi:hypothetical protein
LAAARFPRKPVQAVDIDDERTQVPVFHQAADTHIAIK